MRGRVLGCSVAAIVLAALLAGNMSGAGRLIGGTPVSISTAPWSVVVTYDDGTSDEDCTGVIVDPWLVVTSADCLYTSSGSPDPATSLSVTAGDSNIDNPAPGDQEQDRGVAFYHLDPGYVNAATQVGEDDVAEITLTSALNLGGPDVQAAPLPAANSPYPTNAAATMAAFGVTSVGASDAGVLQSLSTSVEPQGQCGADDSSIDGDDAIYFCATSATATACNGDTGAGLVTTGANPTLVGVEVGYVGSPCTIGSQMLFVNVTSTEILQFVQGNSQPPTAPRDLASGITRITPGSQPYVGEAVSCSSTGWTLPSTLSYSFLGSSGQVLQAGKQTYTLTASDLGQAITCEALATNAGGTDIIQSSPTEAVGVTPRIKVVHVSPSIATRGKTLTVLITLGIPAALRGTFGVCVQPAARVGRKVCSSLRGQTGGPGSGSFDVRIPIGSRAPLGTSQLSILGFAGAAHVDVRAPLRIVA